LAQVAIDEALLDISRGKDYELVIPESTIYIEPKVMLIDRNIHDSQMRLVRAFVGFLWTAEAQESLARSNFRVNDEEIMARYAWK
jgi:ABC-type sulfate transport system substrate-binding protein